MRKIFLVIFATLSLGTHAEVTCAWAQTIHGPRPFREVELISRVHSIGPWRGGDVVLNPWIEISENAVLGVDQTGRLLNVLKLKDRTVAYVLSGDLKIRDIFLRPPGTLLAIEDGEGWVYRFEGSAWAKSDMRHIVTNALANYGATMCTAGMGLISYGWWAGAQLSFPEVLGALGLSSVASIMIEGFRLSRHFEVGNEVTDGMVKLNAKIPGYKRADIQWDGKGEITDYLMQGQSVTAQAGTIADGAPADEAAPDRSFDVGCHHDLLPRGIPPRTFEP